MRLFYLPARTFLLSSGNSDSANKRFHFFFLAFMGGMAPSIFAQQLNINPGSNLILNGAVSVVANNVAFQNNGTFAAGSSTVNFSGHLDTMVSFISGSGSITFNNLTISKSAFGLALKSAVAVKNVLAVNAGNLYTDSNLTLRSDQYLTARVDILPPGSSIIGKALVERYIPSKRSWRLLTAPVTNSNTIYNTWQNRAVYTIGQGMLVTGPNPSGASGNGLDNSPLNNSSMKVFNYSTQQFVKVLNTKTAISPGISGSADNAGYFVFVRGDRNSLNTSVSNVNTTTLTSIGALQTGTQTFTAAPVIANYTMIGNPYASPLDFNNVTRANLIKRFYVWDPTLNLVGGYVVLDDLDNDGVFSKSVTGSPQTKDIQSGQAFFVQTNATAAASITFYESSKSGFNNNLIFRPVRPNTPSGAGTGQITTTLNLLNPGNTTILADGVLAEFDNIYSAGADLDDAAKFTNTNENLSIVRDGFLLAAERRPACGFNDTVYLRLTNATQRNYQFVINVSGLELPGMVVFLVDSYLGTRSAISLSGTTTVNFTINGASASAAMDRFSIVLKPTTVVLPVTISMVSGYQKGNNIVVDWKVENELNMVKYDVEKSVDGAVFTRLNTTKVSGAANTYNSYSWLDLNAVPGNNFYRIKSFARGGDIQYSQIVKVAIENPLAGFSIYPNPVTGNLINLVMKNQPAGVYHVKLTNAAGQQVFEKAIQYTGGTRNEKLNTGLKMPAGIYQLEITGLDNIHATRKVIVE